MIISRRRRLLASAVIAAATNALSALPALAQDAGANYVQINLGANVAGQVDVDATLAPATTFSGDADLETGALASLAGGLGAGNGFTLEGEVLFFASNIDTAEADALIGTSLSARIESYALMVNGLYSFDAGSVSPYVGAGVGYGSSTFKLAGESDDDIGIAWQVKAGVVIPSSETLSWDIGYRFLSLPSFDISEPGVSVDADASAHILSVGARITF